jgi:hypothetical protein
MPDPAVYVMEKMAHGYRRLGRDAGAGFYEYEDDGSVTLWSGLKAFERRGDKVPEEDVRDRLLFIQALEAVRCLEEGIIASVGEADAGSIGLCAFPAATGGAVEFINRMGTGSSSSGPRRSPRNMATVSCRLPYYRSTRVAGNGSTRATVAALLRVERAAKSWSGLPG